MKLRNLLNLIMALSLMFAISCDDNQYPSSENSITKFVVNGLDSQIDEASHTITITVPYGTDVTKLKPSVQLSDKARITPSPDKETNFTNPVKYVITAEDGSMREYTVVVKLSENSEKKITQFIINGIEGTVDETNKKISLILPYGTDLTKLTPTITVSTGASVNPAPGKEVDLSKAVEFTVTAQDKSTQKYTVEVTIGASSAKAITAFSVNDIKGSIDEENKKITVSIPFGYDLTKLTPKVEVSEKASVTPASGVQVDFTKPVKYTVTAEDGTKTEYTADVILGKNNQKEIISFSINNVKGVIDQTNKKITLTLPAGTDVTRLEPHMTLSASASVNPASGSHTNFTNPVEFTVTAEDGTTAKYTATVTVEKYTQKAISKFTVNGVEAVINETNKTISFTLPVGTNVTELKPTFTISQGASASPASGTQVNFTNPVEYTVTAEDGTTAKYAVTANVNKRSGKAITKFVVSGVNAHIEESAKTISFTLPAGTDVTKLKPSVTISEGATVAPASEMETNFTNPVEYIVTAEDGTTAKYTVTANVNKRTGKAITKFTIGTTDATINESAKTITYTLPAGTSNTTLTPVVMVSEGATVSPTSGSPVSFTNPVIYTVTAEDGSTAKYTVTVKNHVLSSEKKILKFTINGVDGIINQSSRGINLRLPKGTDVSSVTPIIEVSPGATVSPESGEVVDFTIGNQYYVTAEDGSKQYYTVIVKVDFDLAITSVSNTSLGQGEIFTIQGQFATYLKDTAIKLVSDSKTYYLGIGWGNSSGELRAQVPQNIPAGTYTLTIEAEGQTVSYPTPITIVAVNKPTITSITPTTIDTDETIITITGTNFGTLSDTMVDIYTAFSSDDYYSYFLSKAPASVTPTSITVKLKRLTSPKMKLKVSVNGAQSNLSQVIDIVW